MKIITNPSHIVRGNLYKSLYNYKFFYNTVLYLGCVDVITNEKFLVIVVDDTDCSYIGGIVQYPCELWDSGFEEQN